MSAITICGLLLYGLLALSLVMAWTPPPHPPHPGPTATPPHPSPLVSSCSMFCCAGVAHSPSPPLTSLETIDSLPAATVCSLCPLHHPTLSHRPLPLAPPVPLQLGILYAPTAYLWWPVTRCQCLSAPTHLHPLPSCLPCSLHTMPQVGIIPLAANM